MSDQSRTVRVRTRPACNIWFDSMRVKGQGPAMQEARGARNSLPTPASRVMAPSAAFHFPSGEQGCCFLQGTLPLFCTSNVFTALPTFSSVRVFSVYRTRTFESLVEG